MLSQECGSNRIRIQDLTLIQKLESNHKIEDRGYIHIQVQFHRSENLPIGQCDSQRFNIGKVQDVVMKLNLDLSYQQYFQDIMIHGSYQYG